VLRECEEKEEKRGIRAALYRIVVIRNIKAKKSKTTKKKGKPKKRRRRRRRTGLTTEYRRQFLPPHA